MVINSILEQWPINFNDQIQIIFYKKMNLYNPQALLLEQT